MTYEENIRISDFKLEEDIDGAEQKAGIGHAAMPEGKESMLSREFGGIELSGGQWQRLAMARSYFRNHEFILLDEPTSAIDPMEENHVYERFKDISQGVTSVIVTHRLGSAKIADRIFVLDKGRLMETGSHEELMVHCGKYKEMFESQAQWYVQESTVEGEEWLQHSREGKNRGVRGFCSITAGTRSAACDIIGGDEARGKQPVPADHGADAADRGSAGEEQDAAESELGAKRRKPGLAQANRNAGSDV
jgi:ABC-type multidrug transport system ATPase subunit